MRTLLIVLVTGVVTLLALAQLVPYGRGHANPAAQREPAWDDAYTRELAVRACYNCHSNRTEWPWYAAIAPASWLVQRDVEAGRRRLNFSEWDRPQPVARETERVVREGAMPPRRYVVSHADARLSAAERQELIFGFEATFAARRPPDNAGAGGRGGSEP